MGRFDAMGRLRIPEAAPLIERDKSLEVGEGKLLARKVYCQNGHSLMAADGPLFDNQPSIGLLCDDGQRSQMVYLSPFYGDLAKICEFEFEPGARLKICCPHCKDPLPNLSPHDCNTGAMYVSLFFEPTGDVHNSVAICTTWGCHASFIRLFAEVITDLRSLAPYPWV